MGEFAQAGDLHGDMSALLMHIRSWNLVSNSLDGKSRISAIELSGAGEGMKQSIPSVITRLKNSALL